MYADCPFTCYPDGIFHAHPEYHHQQDSLGCDGGQRDHRPALAEPDHRRGIQHGMRNLSDNARKLAGVSDAAVATDGFVGNMTKAAESVRNLTLKYDKVAASLDTDGTAATAYVESLKKATNAVNQLTAAYEQTTTYKAEMDKLTNNIAALSKVYGNMLAAMGVNPNK